MCTWLGSWSPQFSSSSCFENQRFRIIDTVFLGGGAECPFCHPTNIIWWELEAPTPPFPTTGLVLSSSISGLVRKEALIAFTLAAVQSVLNCKPLNCTLGRSLLSMITLLDLLHVAKVYFWSTFLQVIYTSCCPAPLWLMIEWKWVSVDSGEPL